MSKSKETETRFMNYFLEHPDKVNKRKFNILDKEIPLFSLSTILSREYNSLFTNKIGVSQIIGRVDVLFSYMGNSYIAEVKSDPVGRTFWYATKVIAYKKWLVYQRNECRETKRLKLAVIIPKSNVNYEFRIIAGLLGINIFCYYRKGKKFYLDFVSQYK